MKKGEKGDNDSIVGYSLLFTMDVLLVSALEYCGRDSDSVL